MPALLRSLLRKPVYFAVSVLTLALGIGAAVFVFALLDGIILNPLNYRDADRLYAVHEVYPKIAKQFPKVPVNAGHYFAWKRDAPAAEEWMIAKIMGDYTLSGDAAPERVRGISGSGDLTAFLGLPLAAGRGFNAAELAAKEPTAIVIAHSLWKRRYQSDPAIEGCKVVLDGKPYTIVGVLAERALLPRGRQWNDILAIERQPELIGTLHLDEAKFANRVSHDFAALVRTRRGETRQQLLTQMNVSLKRLPSSELGDVEVLADLTPLQEQVAGRSRATLWMLMGAALGLFLLVAVNLGNLNLARVIAQRRDWAVRSALGASAFRLMRTVLAESLTVALSGAALGLLSGKLALDWFTREAEVDLPRLVDARIDWRVAAAAVLLALCAALLLGVIPAFRLTRTGAADALRTRSAIASSLRWRGALIGVESALSALLLIVSGLLALSFWKVSNADVKLVTESVVAARVGLSGDLYAKPDDRLRFYERLIEAITRQPGVERAAVVSRAPLEGEGRVSFVKPEGFAGKQIDQPLATYRYHSPGYFETLGFPLKAGRDFTTADRGRKLAVISERAALRIWPGRTAIGQKFYDGSRGPFEVIGVAPNVREVKLEEETGPVVYLPYWPEPDGEMTLVARSVLPPQMMAEIMKRSLRGVDSSLALETPRTLRQSVSRAASRQRWQGLITLAFAVAALLLGAIGVYGVVAQAAEERKSELGIRGALGATGVNLAGLMFGLGLRPVAIGLAIGGAASFAVTRLIASLLYGVSSADAAVYLAAGALLLLVTSVACALPAYKAARVDPATALRAD
ncbi:MAG: ABC transporter permease [Candidatus Solibacter usitatus]|nr:ABC transporter permease [Candidatus Solibacter usitatus]